jgi:peptidoglycan/xylan/chitin deacetylase (PgdA/CDA1 family)
MISRLIGAVAKRLPAHAKERIEEALLGLRDFERLATPRQSALTIVCDDGELNDLDVVQVLDRHGVKGVFAVSPDLIGRPGFLDYEQLRRLRADGHEIAFHGTTHDPFTGFPDRAALLESVGRGLRRLEAEALGTPSTLIYPFGRHNRAVRQAMAGPFQCAFTTWFGINRNTANRFAIRRVPFGAYTGKLPATEAWYRGLLERCAAGNCWPTLMLHPAAPGHTAEHHALLSRLIEHARGLGMPVRTVAAHIGAVTLAEMAAAPADTAQRT